MTKRHLATCVAILAIAIPAAAAQRKKPAVPDLTAGGQADGHHDWNLGPTGARGWIWGWKLETTDARQILITEVASGSPADGVLAVGDVVLGAGAGLFGADARRELGRAIAAAESKRGKGALRLSRWRDGASETVTLRLPVLGDYGERAPWDCARSEAILDRACEHIAGHMKGDIDGMMNALALLATGDRAYLGDVRELARKVASEADDLTLEGRTSGMFAWIWGYRTVFLAEYQLATRDRAVLPAIAAYATKIAEGQSRVGTWGHGMAWPDLNGGQLHGSLGGYGAVNQSGLVCHLGLVLARKCGIKGAEIVQAIERANRFAAFYVGKGAIPYGDHRPGWDFHDDNGKNSLAAIIFDVQGRRDEARFFAKMAAASYAEREQGHTGNYFSYLWGPLGVARIGPDATSAFLREQRWYYDLARRHDGSYPYQGGAAAKDKYTKWDCTGAFVMANALPRRELYITGKGSDPDIAVSGAELEDVIAAGRGFSNWDGGKEAFAGLGARDLYRLLGSWSPAVRSRASRALARTEGDHVERLVQDLTSGRADAGYGACQALGALGRRAAVAVPALTAALGSDDVWMRIQAANALAGIGAPARSAVPAMLELALLTDEDDPREFTQRYLCFCLFYRGGALKMKGLLADSLEGVDREKLVPAVRRLLENDDGRARGAVESVYRHLTLEEITPLLPDVIRAIEEPSPSGVMFSNGIRLAGLELLARHRIAEGMNLCFQVMEIDKWGKKDRIARCLKILGQYEGSARAVIPQLEALANALRTHREAKALAPQVELCEQTIASIKGAPDAPELRMLRDLGVRRR